MNWVQGEMTEKRLGTTGVNEEEGEYEYIRIGNSFHISIRLVNHIYTLYYTFFAI